MLFSLRTAGFIALACLLGGSSVASAQEESRTSTAGYADPMAEQEEAEPGATPKPRPPEASPYRNPTGAFSLGLILGASVGSGQPTTFAAGGTFGYAVITGVVPAVRGVFLAGNGVAGELGATLTLTPPLTTSFTPFVVGELGRRFDSLGGWIYGAGGGLYLGEPAARFALQLGWMFRRIAYPDPTGSVDASGPIIAFSAHF
jgi:hypothetical protein